MNTRHLPDSHEHSMIFYTLPVHQFCDFLLGLQVAFCFQAKSLGYHESLHRTWKAYDDMEILANEARSQSVTAFRKTVEELDRKADQSRCVTAALFCYS